MSSPEIRKSIFLKASPKTVWAYLTEPDKISLWFHIPDAALALGKDFEMTGSESGNPLIWGHVLTFTPYTNLEYNFKCTPSGDHESLVVWTLESVAGGTRLSLVHSGLPEGLAGFELLVGLDTGWDDHIGKMRTHLHG